MSDNDETMTKAKGVRLEEVPQHVFPSGQTRPVTGLGAKLDEVGMVVLLWLDSPERNDLPVAYALSPPDAHYLSKQLRRAVKAYLRSTPGQETG